MPADGLSSLRGAADAVLGLGQSAGWEIPEVGTAVGVFSAVGQTLLDALFPDDAPPTPTLEDIDNAVQSVKDALDKDFFDGAKYDMKTDIQTMNEQLATKIIDAKDPSRISATYLGPLSAEDRKNKWDKGFNDLVAPVDDMDSEILYMTNWISGSKKQQYRFKSIKLYVGAANLWIQICRTAILWEINTAMRDHDADVRQFNKDLQAYNAAKSTWQSVKDGGGDPGPKPKFKGKKPSEVFGTAQIGHSSSYADKIREHLPSFITYLETVLNEVEAAYSSARSDIAAFEAMYTRKTETTFGKIWYEAPAPGETTAISFVEDIATTIKDVAAGVHRAGAIQHLRLQPETLVSPYDVIGLRETLAGWKQLQSDATDPAKDLTKALDT